MTTQFTHEEDANRYAMTVDGELVAFAEYESDDSSISFTHTYTPPAHRGNGYAAQIVEFAISDVEAHSSKRIIPVCWYVAKWFDANPARSELLSR